MARQLFSCEPETLPISKLQDRALRVFLMQAQNFQKQKNVNPRLLDQFLSTKDVTYAVIHNFKIPKALLKSLERL